MSASGTADGNDDGIGPSASLDEWKEIGNDAQRDTLVAAMQERDLGGGDGEGRDWRDIDDATQADTLAAIEQSLDNTWTAHAFEYADDEPTIPFDIHRLSEGQQDDLTERGVLIAQIEELSERDDIEDTDDLRAELDDEAAELFDSLDELDGWLNGFLADITTGPTFDAEWWASGETYPGGLRLELFYEVSDRYADRQEAAESFRTQRRGAHSR